MLPTVLHPEFEGAPQLYAVEKRVCSRHPSTETVVRNNASAVTCSPEKSLGVSNVGSKSVLGAESVGFRHGAVSELVFFERVKEIESVEVLGVKRIENAVCEGGTCGSDKRSKVTGAFHERGALFDAYELTFRCQRADDAKFPRARSHVEHAESRFGDEHFRCTKSDIEWSPEYSRFCADRLQEQIVELFVADGSPGTERRPYIEASCGTRRTVFTPWV